VSNIQKSKSKVLAKDSGPVPAQLRPQADGQAAGRSSITEVSKGRASISDQ
jgi:hypothetical protein